MLLLCFALTATLKASFKTSSELCVYFSSITSCYFFLFFSLVCIFKCFFFNSVIFLFYFHTSLLKFDHHRHHNKHIIFTFIFDVFYPTKFVDDGESIFFFNFAYKTLRVSLIFFSCLLVA